MLKKSLIPKHLLGGPIARLALQKSSGSWGNRGEGNEGLSAFENGLETAVKFIGDISGLTDVFTSIFNNKEEEITAPEIIDGQPVYPLREQPIMGYPTLIPGLKGTPSAELSNFFKTKWGPAYNSLASTKTRLKKLDRLEELTNSKPYIAFQKLNEQLKQMVATANENVVKPVINFVDDAVETIKPERLKKTTKYKHVVSDQEKRGLLGSRSKVAKEADKLNRADAYDDWRLINPGRPAVAKTSEEVINTFRGWANKSKGAAAALRKYELKVAKGIDKEALRKARLECAREILKHEPGSFTAKLRKILGL